jgi:hypothetical protein
MPETLAASGTADAFAGEAAGDEVNSSNAIGSVRPKPFPLILCALIFARRFCQCSRVGMSVNSADGVGKSRNVPVDGSARPTSSKDSCPELVPLAEPGVLPPGEMEPVVEQPDS